MKLFEQFNFPTLLTLFRLLFSPLVLPVLIVYLLPYHNLWINGAIAAVFVLLSVTDFFDGYLARRYNQETHIGKVLDPLADKFLIYATLVGLLAANKIYFYWVIILIGREFFITGLRNIALENNISVDVSFLGKLKTAAQMITMTILILNPYQAMRAQAFEWNACETGMLLLTVVLSLVSAYQYYEHFMRKYSKETETPHLPVDEHDDDEYWS